MNYFKFEHHAVNYYLKNVQLSPMIVLQRKSLLSKVRDANTNI